MSTTAQLKIEFGERAKNSAHYEKLLSRVELMPVQNIPYAERSKLIHHLTNQIIQESKEKDFFLEDDKGLCVFEDPFEREIKQLHRMFSSLAHSQDMLKWASRAAEKLALEFKQDHPKATTNEQWLALDRNDKLALLEELVQRQVTIFSEGAIDFLPSPIHITYQPQVAGFIKIEPSQLDRLTIPDINISPVVIDGLSFNCSAKTVVHEQFHAMVTQFAIAAYNGWMPENHPLDNDAQIMQARRQYYGCSSSFIRSVYRSDPEEIVANITEASFDVAYQLSKPKYWAFKMLKHLLPKSIIPPALR